MKIKKAYPNTRKAIEMFISKYPTPGKILDVGTRDGYAIHLFKKYGFDCYGTDVDESYVKYCNNRGYDVVMDDFENTCLDPNCKFNVVYSSHVIEHCENPINFMKSAHKVLKKNGIVYMYFPLEEKKIDKKHHGSMKHRSFWPDLETFEIEVINPKQFDIIELAINKITHKKGGHRHVEALFVGRKI